MAQKGWKSHLVLLKHFGEISYTAKDVYQLWTGQVTLSEEIDCCASSDNWQLVPVDLYEVREIELPDWVDPAEWVQSIHYQVSLKWFLGFGGNPAWGKDWFQDLSELAEVPRYVAIKLLNTGTFRSAFRRKLCEQLIDWLNTPRPERTYKSPLSPRQWNALVTVHDVRDAKGTSNSLYLRRGVGGRPLTREEAFAAIGRPLPATIGHNGGPPLDAHATA